MAIAPLAARAVSTAAHAQPACATRPRFADALRDAAPRRETLRLESGPLRVLQQVEDAQRRLDHVLEQARAGRTFTAAELLALQAQAHRFSQTVDLATKVVEQGAQTVKQAVNTPI